MTRRIGNFSVANANTQDFTNAPEMDAFNHVSAADLEEWRVKSVQAEDVEQIPRGMENASKEFSMMPMEDVVEQSQLSIASPTASDNPSISEPFWDSSLSRFYQEFDCHLFLSTIPGTSPSSPSPPPPLTPMLGVKSPSEISRSLLPTKHSRTSWKPLLQQFKPFHTSVQQEDFNHLQQTGAFAVPAKRLQNDLLKCYVVFVHGQCPVIDLKDLSDMVRDEYQDQKQISLILFQAVMFAGSAWVNEEKLHAAGFTSREDAQRVLFRRVRVGFYSSSTEKVSTSNCAQLLYDLEVESDEMAVIQALILMTFSKQPMSEDKDSWHWLGIAISLCYRSGLNRDTPAARATSDKLTDVLADESRALRRRIFWSCFIRECTLAIREGRPVRINIADCNVPMLSVEDFTIPTHAEPGEATRVIEMVERCIEKAILCWFSSSKLGGQHAASMKRQLEPRTSSVTLCGDDCVKAIGSFSKSLDTTRISITPESQYGQDRNDERFERSSSSTRQSPAVSSPADYVMPAELSRSRSVATTSSPSATELLQPSDYIAVSPTSMKEVLDISKICQIFTGGENDQTACDKSYWAEVESKTIQTLFGRPLHKS